MPITQKELAQRLGLSRQLVGHALSGYPRVSEETRKLVQDMAAKLGYTSSSNSAARSLIAQRYGAKLRKNALAVLMPIGHETPIRKMPYFMPILDGVELEAAALGLDLSLHTIQYGHMPRYIGDFLVDGVVAMATTVERNEWMHQHGLPHVQIDGEYPQISRLGADQRTGIELCVQHLIDLGHHKIAYFSQSSDADTSQCPRPAAYLDTLKANGITPDSSLLWAECIRMQRDSAADAMARLLRRNCDFTAVVCHNDMLAMGVVDALQSAGLSVPGDVSVTGFDDISGDYGHVPRLTSVSFDREEMGRRAVRMLYQLVNAQIDDPLGTVEPIGELMPVTFVKHQTTGAPSGIRQ